MFEFIKATLQRPNYIAFVVLFLWGLYIAITHHNLVKKLIGMYLVQTSVLFFFVTFSVKAEATVPILLPTAGKVQARAYANPLPHALILTGIVVQVATLGVSLALVTAIYRKYDSLDEDEILKRLE
ncbi:MAG: cation:proton antiporter subunit C [Acidobacteria bacterium]|nr:cation:proton antiporter subunit C [Acidobacteriota bacterium]MCI0721883.1 cation:proton antiporter subunit C [Acidobacteriota bacterium]